MPLASGASQRTFVENIRDMMKAYKRTGKIGNSSPKSAGKANKQAVAASYAQQRKSRTIAHG